MNIKYKLSSIAASLLLVACTSENTLEPPTPPDEGTASVNNTREVLLSLKNKLKVSPVGTKAGDVIATVEENHIYSLDQYIRNTAKSFGFTNIHPVKANAFLYLKSCAKQFDIIFADPPYDIEGSETIPAAVFDRHLLREGGWLILEHSKNLDVSRYPGFAESRSYGSVHFSIFKRD